MNKDKNRSAIIEPILRELLHSGPALGEEQGRLFAPRILTAGEEALVFLFLEIARRMQSSAPSSSTPSGMIPPYLWLEFARRIKRLIQDALRLRARTDFTPERYAARNCGRVRRRGAGDQGEDVVRDLLHGPAQALDIGDDIPRGPVRG